MVFQRALLLAGLGAKTFLMALVGIPMLFASLIPIFLTDGPGADVMRRIALPMVGGMVSTTILTLILIPVIYALYMQWKLNLEKTPPELKSGGND